MTLREKIQEDFKQSMKSQNADRLGTIRMLTAALHNREIEKKSKTNESVLTDEEVLEVIQREAKKRREAAELYTRGNRNDLAEKEKKELLIFQEYLPKQLSDDEVKKVLAEIIAKSGVKTEKDFGKLMGEAMKALKGKADAKKVGEMLKSMSAGNE
jgi:uncharacterized protein